jgi:hypothetical protein
VQQHEYKLSPLLHMMPVLNAAADSSTGVVRSTLRVEMRIRRKPAYWFVNVWAPLFFFSACASLLHSLYCSRPLAEVTCVRACTSVRVRSRHLLRRLRRGGDRAGQPAGHLHHDPARPCGLQIRQCAPKPQNFVRCTCVHPRIIPADARPFSLALTPVMDRLPGVDYITLLDAYVQLCFAVVLGVTVHAVALAVRAESSLADLMEPGAQWDLPIEWQESQRTAMWSMSAAWIAANVVVMPLALAAWLARAKQRHESLHWCARVSCPGAPPRVLLCSARPLLRARAAWITRASLTDCFIWGARTPACAAGPAGGMSETTLCGWEASLFSQALDWLNRPTLTVPRKVPLTWRRMTKKRRRR